MTSIPLQYDSLRTVIQYLEPNLRFKLSQRIPSMRLVERAVPLKINELSFGGDIKISVNDTTYQLGVYRDYPDKVPRIHQNQNLFGGQGVDLDQWGFDDYSGKRLLTPGDVALPRPAEIQFENLGKDRSFYERCVNFFQKAIADRLERGEELVEVPETGPLPPNMNHIIDAGANIVPETPEQQIAFENLNLQLCRNYSIGCFQYNLQKNQEELQRFNCRRDNTSPMFIPKIQLTVTSPEKTEVHRYAYTMKLHEAMKSLCTRFFGSRLGVINVNSLDTVNTRIIRLPVGFRVRIRELSVNGSAAKNYESMKHVIDESSLPLDTLLLFKGLENLEHCDHQMLQSAENLLIRDIDSHVQSYLPMLLILRNPIIDLHMRYWSFPIADQITLIQDWFQKGRPVGSVISYTLWEEGIGAELMNQISEQIASAVVTDLSATIPMISGRQLLVECHEKRIEREPDWLELQCNVMIMIV